MRQPVFKPAAGFLAITLVLGALMIWVFLPRAPDTSMRCSGASSLVRVMNGTQIELRSLQLRNDMVGWVNYGALQPGQTSDYRPWALAYRYAAVRFETSDGPKAITPDDYVTEKCLGAGHFTYTISGTRYGLNVWATRDSN
jgi:hypothetical protein